MIGSKPTRRSLVFAIGGAGALLLSALFGWPYRRGLQRILESPQLGGGEEWADLGSAYLEQYPTEADEAYLLSALFPGLKQPWRSHDPERLVKLIRPDIRRDFEQENVVSVQNWILSRSEARFYALSSLEPGYPTENPRH